MPGRDVKISYIGDADSAVRAARRVEDANQKMDRRLGRVYGRVSSNFGKLGSDLQRKGRGISLGLTAITSAGAIAVAGGLTAAFNEASEAFKVGRQTETVIKTMGASSWTSADQVARLSERFSQLHGVDDEIIQQGANLLLTFKNVRNEMGAGNDVFDRSVRLAGDMSAALGQDMSTSSIQLGKALNDPVRGMTALRRVGVSFTDAQVDQVKAMVESNDMLGAQRLILKEVESQFGGTAAAIATPWDRLKVTFGNILEAIGTRLMPVVERAVALFHAWWPEIQAVAVKGFDKVTDSLKPVADALRPVVEAAVNFVRNNPTAAFAGLATVLGGVLLTALIAVGGAILGLLSPFVLIVGALAAVVAGVVYAYQNFEGFRNVVRGVIDWVTGTAIPAIQGFASAFVETFRGVGEAIGHIMTAIREIIGVVLEAIQLGWRTFGDTILAYVQAVWGTIWGVISGFMTVISGIIKTVLAIINGDWGRAWEGIKQIFHGVWIVIQGLLTGFLEFMKAALSNAWALIKAGASAAWTAVKDYISGQWKKIKSEVSAAATWVKDKLSGIWDSIKKRASDVWRGIRDGISNVWEGIQNGVRSGVNAVIRVINGLIGGINKVLSFLPGLGGKTIPKISELGASRSRGQTPGHGGRGRATGGTIPPFVTDGPRAIVGEGNRAFPEFVIPTDPKYRSRALALLGQAGSKLMASGGRIPGYQLGGLIGDIPGAGIVKGAVGAVGDIASGVAEIARKGAVMAIFNPLNEVAKKAIDAIPWRIARQFAHGVRQWLYDWAKGQDEKLPAAGGGGATGPGSGISGLREPLATIVAKVLAAANGAVYVISGWRSRAQQERLYAKYLAGTGNLAARPGTSKHERGLAVDYGGVQSIYQSLHRKFGGHFPVRGEPWHGEVPGYQHGGIVGQDGFAYLHRGENVQPATGTRTRQNVYNITINVQGGDPNVVVETLKRYMRQNGPVPITVRG